MACNGVTSRKRAAANAGHKRHPGDGVAACVGRCGSHEATRAIRASAAAREEARSCQGIVGAGLKGHKLKLEECAVDGRAFHWQIKRAQRMLHSFFSTELSAPPVSLWRPPQTCESRIGSF